MGSALFPPRTEMTERITSLVWTQLGWSHGNERLLIMSHAFLLTESKQTSESNGDQTCGIKARHPAFMLEAFKLCCP